MITKKRRQKDQEVAQVIAAYEEQIESAAAFIDFIEDGNLDAEYKGQVEGSRLAEAMLRMRDKMRQISAEEKQRAWVNEGLTRFSDLIRNDYETTQDFGSAILSELVKYVHANQGGMFLLNEDGEEPVLEMVACYAYERARAITKTIETHEGLIGQCFLEQDIVHLTEVPSNYVRITSGLGKATPTVLLLVPLIVNGAIYGVLELASFQNIEPHEVAFIKKVAENIAATVGSTQTSRKTYKLLAESQEYAKQLASQQEENRQHIEEMQATQEEVFRQQQELEEKDKQLHKTIAEMEANEQDLIKTEEKYREVVKDFLKMKKEVKAKEAQISELQSALDQKS